MKIKKKTESEIHVFLKVPRPQLSILYLSMKTEVNKLLFIRFRQAQVWKEYKILEIFFPALKPSLDYVKVRDNTVENRETQPF